MLPLTYGCLGGCLGWHWKAPPVPLSLYGLEKLAGRPDAPVVVTEGEKATDAAQQLFLDAVVVTSANGAKASKKTDWSPLSGRTVFIWPDADEQGLAYADEVGQLARRSGAVEVRVLDLGRVRRPKP